MERVPRKTLATVKQFTAQTTPAIKKYILDACSLLSKPLHQTACREVLINLAEKKTSSWNSRTSVPQKSCANILSNVSLVHGRQWKNGYLLHKPMRAAALDESNYSSGPVQISGISTNLILSRYVNSQPDQKIIYREIFIFSSCMPIYNSYEYMALIQAVFTLTLLGEIKLDLGCIYSKVAHLEDAMSPTLYKVVTQAPFLLF